MTAQMCRLFRIRILCILSHNVMSGSDKTPCIKIDNSLVVYIYTVFGNVM